MQKEVPFFNYSALFKSRKQEFLDTMTDVLERGAFIMQRDLKEFEQNLAEFSGCKYAFGVADGTEAILIALRASGVEPGDEVILPSHTFVATAQAVYNAGAKPVLAEVGSDHMLDADDVEKRITSKTKAILPVQLNGRTCNMEKLAAVAKKYGLLIVEDAAQALGSKFKGQCAGTIGSAGTISFYPAKTLGSFGDAGAVLTNDDKVADIVMKLRDHGRGEDGEIVMWGYNSRMDNMQAAILNLKLKTYREDLNKRREIAARYQNNLGDLAQLKLPPAPEENGDHWDIYQNYEIEADNRDDLKKYLEENGVRTIVQWGGKAVHQWEALGFDGSTLQNTTHMFKRCLLIPMHTFLTNDDVDYVCNKIRTFYNH